MKCSYLLCSLHLHWKGNDSWRWGSAHLSFSGTSLGHPRPRKVVRGLRILRQGIFWVGSLYPKEARLKLMMDVVALLFAVVITCFIPKRSTHAQMRGTQLTNQTSSWVLEADLTCSGIWGLCFFLLILWDVVLVSQLEELRNLIRSWYINFCQQIY